MIFIDSGKHHQGVARFDPDSLRLWQAWLHGTDAIRPAYIAERCQIEVPQKYESGPKARVRTKDLMALHWAAGRVTALYLDTRIDRVLPSEWKGQVPKKVTHERMWKELDAREVAVLQTLDCRPSLRHNVYDAVYMGLKFLGRC